MQRAPLPVCLVAAVVVSASCGPAGILGSRGEPLPEPTREDHRIKETAKGTLFWPISAPVEKGVEYSFNSGHCGLSFLTDFDGSFWDPVNPNEPREPPEFFYNEDEGTMTLVSGDRAVYTSSSGEDVTLRQHDGPVLLKGACG